MDRPIRWKALLWRAWLICAGIGLLFALWISVLFVGSKINSESEYATSSYARIEGFREHRPDVSWHRIDVRGSRYYVAQGNKASLLSKGPAIYVFDQNGNLVDWSRDSGKRRHPRIVFYEGVEWAPVKEAELPGAPGETL